MIKYLLSVFFFYTVFGRLQAQPSGEQHPTVFLTDSAVCTEVKDQAQSPTCWVFGTNSLFESDLIKKYNLRLDLSEMFIARYAYIDKAKKYVETKGKTYFAGGGQFRDVIRVVNNYGMVPENDYRGIPIKRGNHNHANLDSAMSRLGRKFLRQGKTQLNASDIQQFNDTLDKYLGKVPASFWYDMQEFTPKTFVNKIIHFNNDYIELMSFSNLPYYQKCLLDDKFNWAGDSLYNIPLDDMQMLVDSALANGWSIGWEGDVTEPGFTPFTGSIDLNNTQHNYDEERSENYKTEATERDHMLHLVGVGRDENKKKWYHMKNSWGNWANNKGYLFMSEEYFKLKTVVLMVNKDALPGILKKKLKVE